MLKKIFLFLTLLLCPIIGSTTAYAEPLNLNQILEATCRVRAGNASGSGTCIMEDQNNYYFLTNAHVVGGSVNLAIEMFINGKQSKRIPGKVVWKRHQGRTDVDFAIIRVSKTAMGKFIPRVIPVVYDGYKISQGQYIASAGCPQARWANAWEGHATTNSQSRVLFVPPPLGGQSGSGIHVYLKDPSGEWHTRLAAVLTWSIGNQGGAIPTNTLYAAMQGRVFEPQKIPNHWIEVAKHAIHYDQWAKGTDNKYYKMILNPEWSGKGSGSHYVRMPPGIEVIKWYIKCPLCDVKGVQNPNCPNCPPNNGGGFQRPPRGGGGTLPVPPSRPDRPPTQPQQPPGIPDIGSPWPPKPTVPIVDKEKEQLKKDKEQLEKDKTDLEGKNKELEGQITESEEHKGQLEDRVVEQNLAIEKLQQDIQEILGRFEGLTAKDKETIDILNAELIAKNIELKVARDTLIDTQRQLKDVKVGLSNVVHEFEELKKDSNDRIFALEKGFNTQKYLSEDYLNTLKEQYAITKTEEKKDYTAVTDRELWRYRTDIVRIVEILDIR